MTEEKDEIQECLNTILKVLQKDPFQLIFGSSHKFLRAQAESLQDGDGLGGRELLQLAERMDPGRQVAFTALLSVYWPDILHLVEQERYEDALNLTTGLTQMLRQLREDSQLVHGGRPILAIESVNQDLSIIINYLTILLGLTSRD